MIISVEKAFELADQQNVVFADCRFDLKDTSWGYKQFENEHIPNSVYFNLEKDLSGAVKETGGRHPLPIIEEFIEKLAKKGIDRRTPVIIYDQNRAFASRLYWMLKFINHPEVYLMNGGLEDWKVLGFPTNQEPLGSPKKEYGSYDVQHDMIADQAYVKKHKDSNRVTLIDSRSYDRYIGKIEPIDKKAGHIPGAINMEWNRVLDHHQRFKIKQELKDYFKELDSNDEIIVYCGSGVTATPNVVALWMAEYKNVRLYVGSFSDWISNEDNEVISI